MRKIILIVFSFYIFSANAQHATYHVTRTNSFKGVTKVVAGGSGACDTANFQTAINNWTPLIYTVGSDQSKGYIFGVSNLYPDYSIQRDANYFDLSSTNLNYITGGLIYFAIAGSTEESSLDKDVLIEIQDAQGGGYFASGFLSLRQIQQATMAGNLTEFKLLQVASLPNSKQIFVVVDHAQFGWGAGSTHDSLAIVANGDDESQAAAWQYVYDYHTSQNFWTPVNQFWSNGSNPLDVNLWIFPYLSSSAEGCSVLAMTIINFNASITDAGASLSWRTAGEVNNKGFEIERSEDGQRFSDLGFVNGSGTSNKIHNYNYNDLTLSGVNSTTVFYRLKQINQDGETIYSKVVPLTLKGGITCKLYPNPVKDKLSLSLNLNKASVTTVQIISKDGKTVLKSEQGGLSSGNHQICINVAQIANGTYFMRLTTSDQIVTKLFIKE
ncbi:MAG: T9SS type A sorting domain-containing protein [Parafilimonas sp.]